MNPLTLVNSFTCDGCNFDSNGVKGFKYTESTTIRKVSDIKINYQTENEVAKGVLVSDTFRINKDDESTTLKEYPFLLVSEWQQDKFELT